VVDVRRRLCSWGCSSQRPIVVAGCIRSARGCTGDRETAAVVGADNRCSRLEGRPPKLQHRTGKAADKTIDRCLRLKPVSVIVPDCLLPSACCQADVVRCKICPTICVEGAGVGSRDW